MDSRSPMGEIIIYESGKGKLEVEVKLQDETIWLTQKQIAEVFGKDVRTINEHIQNIFTENELEENSTIRKFRIVQSEGKRQVNRELDHYNLDMILSVGYRVSSKKAAQFRIWANRVLKNYLLKGYAVNQDLLAKQEMKFKELQEVVCFINDKKKFSELSGQADELIEIINSYTNSLDLLGKYDANKLEFRDEKEPEFVLEYDVARKFIDKLIEKLNKKGEVGSLFGQERDQQFRGILGGLYQTFGGEELYESVEMKAANLLYFIIKDHPFSDGNKRIGSLLFVYFLERNNYLFKDTGERKIADNTLAALALLIATSNPREKDVMIKIVTNLL